MNPPSPHISICIPAYKRVEYLRRLLLSIREQSFRDMEIILTDDSPDDSVKNLINGFPDLSIRYFRNEPALGTPANWNRAIRLASGKWIKLMHDDDWFSSPEALQEFARAAAASNADFVFSAYNNVQEGKPPRPIFCSSFRLRTMLRNPVTLVAKNSIGPPSAVLHRNTDILYDKRMKWLVDMDFYIRFLYTHTCFYIAKPLVNIGISESQVTRSSSLVAEVEIPEHFLLLNKTGIYHLRNLLVYDAWWRLFRNLGIREEQDIRKAGYTDSIPVAIQKLIRFQSKFSLKILRIGPLSKLLMVVCYLFNRPPEASLSIRKAR